MPADATRATLRAGTPSHCESRDAQPATRGAVSGARSRQRDRLELLGKGELRPRQVGQVHHHQHVLNLRRGRARAPSPQVQDMLMVVYLANLTRTQLALAEKLQSVALSTAGA